MMYPKKRKTFREADLATRKVFRFVVYIRFSLSPLLTKFFYHLFKFVSWQV
jgi:hypothetical protein